MSIDPSNHDLLTRIRACTICTEEMAPDPRPVLSWHSEGRILLIGQAPGSKVHGSGVAWQDASGNLLRTWLGVDDQQFYDPRLIALAAGDLIFTGTPYQIFERLGAKFFMHDREPLLPFPVRRHSAC